MCAASPFISSNVDLPGSHKRRLSISRFLPAIIAVGVTLIFELKPNPSLKGVNSIPGEWISFIDDHDFLMNVIGFGGLAATIQFGFLGFYREPWPDVARRAAWLGGVVVLLELTQLFLPRRSCDWHDVAAGWLGIAMASLPWASLRPVRIRHGE